MNKLLLALFALYVVSSANAGTLVITSSGFSNLPTTAPSNWPPSITWPGGQSPNGSKTYTVSDADLQTILAWTAITQPTVPQAPTATQILLVWIQQILANPTIRAVQQFFTPAPVPPAPIVMQ